MNSPPFRYFPNLNGESETVRTWWESLDVEAQTDLALSWTPEAEDCRFALQIRLGPNEWATLPFLPLIVDEEVEIEEDWEVWREFYEFAVNHELRIWDNANEYAHGICTQNPEARKHLQRGTIHLSFGCSEGSACRIRKLAAFFPQKKIVLQYSVTSPYTKPSRMTPTHRKPNNLGTRVNAAPCPL